MVELNDIILESGVFYRVIHIDESSQTMDLKCFNQSMIIRCIPISNLKEIPDAVIMKEVPENIKFLRKL
jgi:hypothetical protein